MARGCPPRTCASEALFPGRQTKLADAPGAAHPLGGRRATAGPPLSFNTASGGSKGCAQAHEKLGDGEGVCCGDGSAKRTARRAATCLGVARWRLRPGPRARARGGAMQDRARCAANMAADGRRVVGGDRGTCCGTCEAVRAPQGRHLTVLHAAAAAESRENLLRRMMPWHLCIKINPANRLISSSCARPYFDRLYILSEHIILHAGQNTARK